MYKLRLKTNSLISVAFYYFLKHSHTFIYKFIFSSSFYRFSLLLILLIYGLVWLLWTRGEGIGGAEVTVVPGPFFTTWQKPYYHVRWHQHYGIWYLGGAVTDYVLGPRNFKLYLRIIWWFCMKNNILFNLALNWTQEALCKNSVFIANNYNPMQQTNSHA